MNFTRAIIRTPGPDATQGLTTAGLGAADFGKLQVQHAANVLMVNGKLLVPAGFPRTLELLSRYRVVALDQSEVRKLDGALTCMSLRF